MAEGLLALPQELRIQIMSNLDAISLTNCAMTCKLLYETRQCSSHLEYIVQLYLNGYEDAKTSTAHSEIIQRLLHYREAWVSLPPNKELEHIAVDMKQPCYAYELVGGAFADADSEHFEIVQLPTTYGNNESPLIRTASTGIPIRDFAMDPTQDLIVFLEPEEDIGPPFPMSTRTVRLHIRTISTNSTHPLAQQSPLQFTLPTHPSYGPGIRRAQLQLARNILVLYYSTESPAEPWVHMWDWTTSDVVVDSTVPFDPLLPLSRYEIGLLDSTRCFLASQAGSGSIRLYNLPQPSSTPGAPLHLATLHLPPTSRGAGVFSMSLHAGPVEAHPQPRMPYTINDEDRIHAFRVIYQVGRIVDIKTSLDVFVHQRVFTKYCMRGMVLRDSAPAASPLDVPWAEWGPQNTHVVSPSVVQAGWQRSIHGQRVIYPASRSRIAHILDFSRAAVQTSSALREPSAKGMPWNTPHSWDLPFLAAKTHTYLPVAASQVACKAEYSKVMIYADGIVGVDTKYNDGSLLLHVYPISQEEKNATWDD